ncbi:MAG TPA: hypothetical protein VLE51_03065 [Candidatus Saccharimonadales bacterium]|nr:hypothetical protein [Candidatus Saccharimonadales bacterium]
MNEKDPSRPDLPKLTITHDEAINDRDLRMDYVLERVARVKAGLPTWKLRGFNKREGDEGYVYDFYFKDQMRGYIEGNDLDGYQVYLSSTDEDEDRPQHLNTEPIDYLRTAQELLEDAVSRASS